MEERYEGDPDILFLACTMPVMRWGVPVEGFMFSLMLWCVITVACNHMWLLGGFGVSHLILRHLASQDHNFFRVYRLWIETFTEGLSTRRHGMSTFDPISPVKPRGHQEISICV